MGRSIMGHVFPLGVLATVTLLGGRAGDGAPRATARCELSFPYAQWPSSPYQEQRQVPACWSRSPMGWVPAGSIPCVCVLCPLPAKAPLAQRTAALEYLPRMVTWWGLGQSWHTSQNSRLLLIDHPLLPILNSSEGISAAWLNIM